MSLSSKGPSSPLCGAETTFSGFSKDPSRPLRRELKTTHATCCAQCCDSCSYNARYQLKDCLPSLFFVHNLDPLLTSPFMGRDCKQGRGSLVKHFEFSIFSPLEPARVVPGNVQTWARGGCKCTRSCLLLKTLQRYDIRRHHSDDSWRCRTIPVLYLR